MSQDEEELYNNIIALVAHRTTGLKVDTYYELIRQYGAPRALIGIPPGEIGCAVLASVLQGIALQKRCKEDLLRLHSLGVRAISLGSQQYPKLLASIYRPPIILFYRGNFCKISTKAKTLAIVGSRKGDSFGCSFARDVGQFAANRDVCIVSGLALGIDAAAHHGALESRQALSTVAVLGSGLGEIYPRMHEPLARRILDSGGALVSQFEYGAKPYPSNFLDRNRVIAGLAEGALVIQAPKRSGSLATARYALEEGREVMVIPGAINDPRYEGSNRLIKQGAHVILDREDILEFIPSTSLSSEVVVEREASSAENWILRILKERGTVQYDELALTADSSSLATAILELESLGLILRLPGNFVTLKSRFED